MESVKPRKNPCSYLGGDGSSSAGRWIPGGWNAGMQPGCGEANGEQQQEPQRSGASWGRHPGSGALPPWECSWKGKRECWDGVGRELTGGGTQAQT